MPFCSTGISGPKAGVNASVVVDQGYVQSLLPPLLSWLYPYIPYMHGLEIGSVADFCADDPPTWTVPTPLEFINFLSGGPLNDYLTVNQFLQDITKYYLWFQLCECKSVATPAPSSPPAAPANMPGINPPGVVTPTVDACSTFGFSQAHPNDSTQYYGALTPIPAGATHVNVSGVFSVPALTSGSLSFGLLWGTAGWSGYPGSTQFTSPLPYVYIDHLGVQSPGRVQIPSGATHYWTDYGPVSGFAPAPVTVNAVVNWYCGLPSGSGSFNIPAPCPPDPYTLGLLRQLLELVTLIQRQAVPFSYVTGTSHTGLTGDGSLSVQGLIGAKITVTNMGYETGVEAGDPDELWNVGWVNWGNADGYSERQWISTTDFLTLPSLAGQYTQLNYSLKPGVQVDVLELSREP